MELFGRYVDYPQEIDLQRLFVMKGYLKEPESQMTYRLLLSLI